MPKAKKLTLAVLINAALISSTYASEQSEAKGFVEDANGSVLFRTGFLNRDKKDNSKLIDINTLSFVAIHELSHVMTKSIGHNSEFWENFKFLLQEAKIAGIHDPIDYKKKPEEYCSMKISDNPYYDI